MRTEDELRCVFEDIAAAAPDTDRDLVHTRPQRHPRNRRTMLIAAAAGATATLVFGYAVDHSPTRADTAAAPPVIAAWTAVLTPPDGWQLNQRNLYRGGVESIDIVSIITPNFEHGCTITSGPGADAPDPISVDQAMTIAGKPGRVGRVGGDRRWHVRWQPVPGRWADTACYDQTSAASAVAVSQLVTLTGSGVSVPVSAIGLPYGLKVVEAHLYHDVDRRSSTTSGAPGVAVRLSANPDTTTTTPTRFPDRKDSSVLVAVGPADVPHGGGESAGAVRLPDISGHPTWLSTSPEGVGKYQTTVNELLLWDGPDTVLITGHRTSDQLVAIAAAMNLADPLGDTATWFPAIAALGE